MERTQWEEQGIEERHEDDGVHVCQFNPPHGNEIDKREKGEMCDAFFVRCATMLGKPVARCTKNRRTKYDGKFSCHTM